MLKYAEKKGRAGSGCDMHISRIVGKDGQIFSGTRIENQLSVIIKHRRYLDATG